MNPATRMSTADRMIELAVRNGLVLKGIAAFNEAAEAIANELISEAPRSRRRTTSSSRRSPRPPTRSRSIRRTRTWSSATRRPGEEAGEREGAPASRPARRDVDFAAHPPRDARHVERAPAPRPRQEQARRVRGDPQPEDPGQRDRAHLESRNVSEEVPRIIATNKSWVQDHQIKLNLVNNPRTPFVFSSRLIAFLRENELKQLAKSKNVSAAVAQIAKQHLGRKKK